MRPRSNTSPRAFSPLQKSSVTYATFSDALVALGFNQAQSQNYEWLTSYPEARPFLNAIQTSFTPECVLSEAEAATFENLSKSTPQLPDEQLYMASRPLMNGTTQYPDVHHQRRSRLEAARKQLSMLKKQKEVLEEALSHKRARPRGALSPHTPPLRRNRLSEEQSTEQLADELAAFTPTESLFMGAEEGVAAYIQKEEAFSEELRSYAQQTVQDEVHGEHRSSHETKTSSLKGLVRSYAAIKSNQFIEETRLARANAILIYINMNKAAYTEMPLTSVRSLIKDQRHRGSLAIKARAKELEDEAQETLWNQIQDIALSETLRQQESLLELERFCAARCLEQRLRIHSFNVAVKAQEKRLAEVSNALLHLSLPHENSDQNNKQISACGSDTFTKPGEKELEELQRILEESAPLADDMSTDNVISMENDVFDSAVETLADMLTDFANRIGCDDSWLRFESHAEFAPLVEDYERVLNYNTSILEAVLKRRRSPKGLSPRSRNWVQIVNSSR